MEMLLKDKKYTGMQKENQIDIYFSVCNFDDNEYVIDITRDSE